MKKLLYSCSIWAMATLAITTQSHAQCSAPTAPTWVGASAEDMYYHTYTNENTVYTGGKAGQIGKGTFANGKWTFVNVSIAGVSADSRAGFFYPNSEIGFIATDDAKLYKTTNGGNSYTELVNFNSAVNSGDVNHIVFAKAPNQDFGIVAAEKGLFITTNGGINWARQNNFNNSMLNDTNPGEFFTVAIEGNIAYAVTDIDEEGQIFYTTFSGTSTTLTWNAMKFADKGATDYYMAQEKGRGITITPNGTIWNAAAQYLLKATNTSATFQVVTVAGSADEIEIRGVSFFDDSKGAFANANGDVFVTTNAGVNWSLLGNVPSEPKAIIYSPAGKSLAVAADAGSGVPGTFLTNICTPPLITVVTSTLPLGVVCTAASAPIWANAGDKDIYFHAYSDENTVFAGGSDGLAGKGTYSNGKWTFSTLTIAGASDANFRAGYFFPNTTVGFFANDDAKLFKTIDGGTTFSEIAGFNTAVEEGDVNHLVFAPAPNQNIGFAAAQGGLFVTTNGGSNWTQQTMFTNSMLNATNPGEFFTVAIQGTKAYAVTDIDEEGQIFYADILASGTDFTWNAMKFADKGATDYYMAQEKGRSIAITPNGTIWNVAAQYLLKATSFDATFQLVTVAGSADEIEIRGVAFYDNNNGAFANGNGDVFVTANAGGTWTKIGNVPSEPKAIAISPLGTTFAVAADVAGTVVGTFISSRCTSIVDPTSTLEDVASENQNIYPNPATHVINMQLNANDTWSLCDLTGSVLKSGNTAANTLISENISDLASGIYIVKVASAKGTKAIKLYKTN